ncbi:MAG: helix-turn-helix transcriptional regulator [Thermomicrobiales bacterium]
MRDPAPAHSSAAPASPVALVPPTGRPREGGALPLPLTPLVGRHAELAKLRALVEQHSARLITLVGPGGVGKTRLAIAIAREVTPRFPDGVVFIPLAAVTVPSLVLPVIAQTLGLRDAAGQAAESQVAEWLHGRTTLLVLDNVEQVIAAAPSIAELLRLCPTLMVLATSRVPCNVSGEQEFPVPPLSLPPRQGQRQPAPSASRPALGSLDSRLSDPSLPRDGRLTGRDARPPSAHESEAVTFFLDRAQATKPDFALTETNAIAVAEICRRLDGLPLAIELAAARVKVLSPQALLNRLAHGLDILSGGPRDLPARLRTMRDAIAWSFDLLTLDEQTLFRRLAVFAGGCTLDAAEVVAEGGRREAAEAASLPSFRLATPPSSASVLDGLASLVDKSLLRQEERDGEPRFTMIETIREYALERLRGAGEEAAVRAAHVAFFLARAEMADEDLRGGAGQDAWLRHLDAEHDNLRAALDWAMAHAEPAIALRLASALWRFWETRGHLHEGVGWIDRALRRATDAPPDLRAKALNNLGNLLSDLGDDERALPAYTQSLNLRRELDDRRGLADTLNNLGLVATDLGNYPRARELLEESLALRRALDDRPGYGLAVNNLGDLAIAEGDADRAWALHREALAVREELDDLRGIAYSNNNLGVVALMKGDFDAARALLDESLRRFRELGDRAGAAYSLRNQGEVSRRRGDHRAFAARYAEALALRAELDDRRGIAECFEGLAATGMGTDDHQVRLLAAAASLRQAIGIPIPAAEEPEHHRLLDELRDRMGEPAFAAAWHDGRARSLEESCAAALAAAPTAGPADHDAAGEASFPDGLSEREVQVLRLVAKGMTNTQIADALFISPRTINAHLTRIYRKIGVTSRTAAARYAYAHDLL